MSEPARQPHRAVFLDRDGVINRCVPRGDQLGPPHTWAELELLPGVAEALDRLRRAGFLLIVVTNQPDVATGVQRLADVEVIHERLRQTLALDDIKVCCHVDADECACRKPKPGMLLEAARQWSIDLAESFLVGDRWRDIGAGRAAGCRTILVRGNPDRRENVPPAWTVDSLSEAADWILSQTNTTQNNPLTTVETVKQPHELRIKIFADGADLEGIAMMARNPLIQGFTTNPTLMRKAGVSDYRAFALDVLKIVPELPVSFEVFSDEFAEMEAQAREIASWGKNVFVKIPVSNTRNVFSGPLIQRLAQAGVKLNVTALMTTAQVAQVLACLRDDVPSYVSVFAGRVADTGRDPVPLMAEAMRLLRSNRSAELIWASPRELLNIYHAESIGCHVITVTNDVLKKLSLVGKGLDEYSLDTVKMFYEDAAKAGYRIETGRPK